MIRVVVGILLDADTRVLVSRRKPGKHRAGAWEFPGGKFESGEDALAALQRELREELSIETHAAHALMKLQHQYPERHVELDIWLVDHYSGTPIGNEGQEIQWVHTPDLRGIDLLEADSPIVTRLEALTQSE